MRKIKSGAIEVFHGLKSTTQVLNKLRNLAAAPILSPEGHRGVNERVAWVESVITLNPVALSQTGLRLQNFTFFECGNDWEWVAQEVLQANLFQKVVLVVGECPRKDAWDRLQRATQQCGITLYILVGSPGGRTSSRDFSFQPAACGP